MFNILPFFELNILNIISDYSNISILLDSERQIENILYKCDCCSSFEEILNYCQLIPDNYKSFMKFVDRIEPFLKFLKAHVSKDNLLLCKGCFLLILKKNYLKLFSLINYDKEITYMHVSTGFRYNLPNYLYQIEQEHNPPSNLIFKLNVVHHFHHHHFHHIHHIHPHNHFPLFTHLGRACGSRRVCGKTGDFMEYILEYYLNGDGDVGNLISKIIEMYPELKEDLKRMQELRLKNINTRNNFNPKRILEKDFNNTLYNIQVLFDLKKTINDVIKTHNKRFIDEKYKVRKLIKKKKEEVEQKRIYIKTRRRNQKIINKSKSRRKDYWRK